MPNWKKVIVSGSNAVLNNVTASGGITTGGTIQTSGDISASGDISTNTLSIIEVPIGGNGIVTVDTFDISTYNGAIYDYILKATSVGARTGQFMVSHDNSVITFTDTSTKHLTDPIIPEITADINSGNARVRITNGGGYTFKSFTKKL